MGRGGEPLPPPPLRVPPAACDILHKAQDVLRESFNIDHTTIQIEECEAAQQCGEVPGALLLAKFGSKSPNQLLTKTTK